MMFPLPAPLLLCRLEHLHGQQHSSQRPCYRRPGTRFAVRENFQQATVDFSTLIIFKRLPSQDTNAMTDSFYGTELGLPLFLLFSTRSDRLPPYCYFTFLAGTHDYLAGIHNYFFTIWNMTTVHHGLPLGGWYCTISFLFFEVRPNQMASLASPGLRSCRAWPLPRGVCAIFKWSPVRLLFVFPLFG